MKIAGRIIVTTALSLVSITGAHAASATLSAQADVDIRSTAASENIGYNRNVLIVANRNADPSVSSAGKAYIRFQLPADFGSATNATFTMNRAILGSFAWTYSVYGLDQGTIPGSLWDELTWPEINTGTPTTATTWLNAPGNVTDSSTAFSNASLLGTFVTKNAANGGVAGDQFSITGEDLINFINADTNGFVTFMVSRAGASSSLDQWASGEHGSHAGPALIIEYEISTNLPARIATQPEPPSQTVYATQNVIISATASGTPPITNQWRLNGTNLVDGPNVSGANSNVLTLWNVTENMAGEYSLVVANEFGQETSSNATLSVDPSTVFFNSGKMTNIWNLLPGERPYLTTLGVERGLAYNPVTTNLYVVSSISNTVSGWVAVLDAQTGDDKYFLNTSGVFPGVGASSLALNLIDVSEDGSVYGAGQVINASNYIYYIYRWENDGESTVPTLVFFGDPGFGVERGLRWGDNFAVRGTGADAQILIAPSNGTNSNVVLLRTASGTDFNFEIPPTTLAISGLPADAAVGFAARGIAFGPGTNTFWAKSVGNQLYLVEFDLDTQTGTVIKTYPNSQVPANLVGIAVDKDQKYLAGVADQTRRQNIRLYDISDLDAGPTLLDQAFFQNQMPDVTSPGWAAISFGGDYLFALNSNYGIKAFLIDTNWTPVSSFPISGIIQENGSTVLTWASEAGHNYQVQFRNDLTGDAWGNLGDPIKATSASTSATNAISNETTFYRVQGL